MSDASCQGHVPVLLDEVIEYIHPKSGGVYVDGNLGLGGHSNAILENSSPAGKVIGFDWDSNALAIAEENLTPFGDRFTGFRKNFTEIGTTLDELNLSGVDGILLDLGLSSLQLDGGARGFSFKGPGHELGLEAASLPNPRRQSGFAACRNSRKLLKTLKKSSVNGTDCLFDLRLSINGKFPRHTTLLLVAVRLELVRLSFVRMEVVRKVLCSNGVQSNSYKLQTRLKQVGLIFDKLV